VLLAWTPYAFLVTFVLLWGLDALPVKAFVTAPPSRSMAGAAQRGDAHGLR